MNSIGIVILLYEWCPSLLLWLLVEQGVQKLKVFILERLRQPVLALLLQNLDEFFCRRVFHLFTSGFLVLDFIGDRPVKILVDDSVEYLAWVHLLDFLLLVLLLVFDGIVLLGLKVALHLSEAVYLRLSLVKGDMGIFVGLNAVFAQNFKAVFVGAKVLVFIAGVFEAVLLDLLLPVLVLSTGKHAHILSYQL